MSSDAANQQPVKNREWIAELLERVAPVVEWDRFVVEDASEEQIVEVYGWIDREEDEYKDFVWTRFYTGRERLEYCTSSDQYTEYLMAEWFGEDSLDEHNECRRVEHAFDVENAIELTEDTSIEEFATDGGVEGHFHSGDHHVLYDDHSPEQQRSAEDSCIECGSEAFNHRCGCCGFPLCSKHHELGAGFCSKFLTVGGVPVCVYDYDTYVGTHMRHDPEPKVLLAATEDTDVYHLPDEEGESAPLCRPKEDGKLEVSLSLVADTDHELCSLCEESAAKELAERKQIDGGEDSE